jgi:hypothetical protein
MDIENYEIFALEGARRVLEQDKPVVYLELWPNENRDKCFNLLESLGYKAYVANENGLELYTNQNKQNFIFKINE